MDTFENNQDLSQEEIWEEMEQAEEVKAAPPQEQAPEQPQVPPQEQPWEWTPPQKASPFANSPYCAGGAPVEPVQSVTPAKKKKEHRGLRTVVACLLTVALVIAGCGITAGVVNDYWQARWEENQKNTADAFAALSDKIAQLQEEIKKNSYTGNGNSVSGTPNVGTDGGLTPGQVYAQNVDAVVAISNQATTTNIYGQVTESASSGSGFIISDNGYIVTNYHVIQDATKLTVMLNSGAEYAAAVVGYDSANDMAVLKINATGLPFVTLGSSSDLIVGDQVVAIGNPLGELTNTLTVGYVSAVDRDISTGGALINMIQTDVAINSGNSGGPLFNMKGEVVGITTAKYSGTSNSGATIEGISFAVPIDDLIKKITDLKDYGYLKGAYLGITVSDTDPTYAEYFGIPTGAYVRSVEPGYCAAKAGMQAKDVIVKVGAYDVSNLNDLSRALEKYNPGDTVKFLVYRGGGQVTLEVTLDERPPVTNSDVPSQDTEQTPTEGNVPENGSFEDWFDYFFGNGNG